MSLHDDTQAAVAEDFRLADSSRRYATLTFMRGSIVALCITLSAGLLGVLYYIPTVASVMQTLGIRFASLRPIHTTFAAAFIFLGGVAVVHRYFEDVAGPMGNAERWRLRIQVILWAIAGIGILSSLLFGVFSGREYMGFHPIFSIPVLLGWLLFTWNFFAILGKGLLHRPVYVSMWAVGVLFFIYTFVEQHAWLLSSVFADPLTDIRLQWKATGTLVGSFNLLVYGSLVYIGVKITKCESYAYSRLAYALFGVGLLNSFTNFGHHTYHLPQHHLVKWISFVISMTEIIILARVVWDIAAMVKSKCLVPVCSVRLFLAWTKWWTGYILATSILMSIPPLNALIHGTTVVMAHGMGAEIGIDAMALFAAISWIIIEMYDRRGERATVLESGRFRRWIIGFNVGVMALIGWLTISGVMTAVRRYNGIARPEWLESSNHYILAGCGVVAGFFLGRLLYAWLGLLFVRHQWVDEQEDT